MLDLSALRVWLEASGWLWPCLAALVGLQFGSFLNVLVWRLPQMMQREWAQQCAELQGQTAVDSAVFNLAVPSSHCPNCKTPLRFPDLIPVFGFVWRKGRCGDCEAPISWRYPLVELSVALLWAICAVLHGVNVTALAWALCGTVLLALALIDVDTMLLPDSLTLPLMWAGILCASLAWIPLSLEQSVWGAVAGYVFLWTLQTVFGWVTGKQGMGEGDFKLLAALGAWLGVMALPVLLLLSSVSGVLVAVYQRVRGQLQEGEPLPFGPHLVLGAVFFKCFDLMHWIGA